MSARIRLLAGTSLALMSSVSSLGAQTVAGRVLDRQSKVPLDRVAIVLVADTGAASHTVANTTTDSLGVFYIDAPSAGVYRLRFTTPSDTLVTDFLALKHDELLQREYLLQTRIPNRVYLVFEIEKQVVSSPHNRPPIYPPALSNSNVHGQVLVQFVVDTTGKAEMDTFKVLESSDVLFNSAVRHAVTDYEFEPATIAHRKVKQLVQMPFCFDAAPSPARQDTGRFGAMPPEPTGACRYR